METFKIDGLNRLKTIIIGNNSFSQVKQEWFHFYYTPNMRNAMLNKQSKSFHILNCESLESIQIGTIENDSYNFRYSSFVIRGIEMILNIVMIRSSKSTIHHIRL